MRTLTISLCAIGLLVSHAADAAEPVSATARNGLCAVALPEVNLTADNFAQRILDADVKVATATPKADPAGDLTWEMFRQIDKQKTGAFEILDRKAKQIVGKSVGDLKVDPVAVAFARGEVNMMIGYCSAAPDQVRNVPGAQIVRIPTSLAPPPQ